MRVAIDGAQIGSQADLHRVLAGPLDFGPYYGHNLSALWDRLSRDVERPVEIIWENAAVSRGRMGDEVFEAIVRPGPSCRERRAECTGQEAHRSFHLTWSSSERSHFVEAGQAGRAAACIRRRHQPPARS
ncbi:barstar family protein (plasmid) [[Kitasatospora] papulosa]